jgi:hypothetical protein
MINNGNWPWYFLSPHFWVFGLVSELHYWSINIFQFICLWLLACSFVLLANTTTQSVLSDKETEWKPPYAHKFIDHDSLHESERINGLHIFMVHEMIENNWFRDIFEEYPLIIFYLHFYAFKKVSLLTNRTVILTGTVLCKCRKHKLMSNYNLPSVT